MIRKIEVERFRLTSSRPVDEVLASIKGAVGQQALEPWRTGLGYSSRNLRMVVRGSTAKRSRMRTLSLPPLRSWEIRKERRVLEKNHRSSSALRRWRECLALHALGSGRRLSR